MVAKSRLINARSITLFLRIVCACLLVPSSYFLIRYWHARIFLVDKVAQGLYDFAQKRKTEIVTLLDQEREKVQKLANQENLLNSFGLLSQNFALPLHKEEPDYKKYEVALDQYIADYADFFQNKDILLANRDGTIFYVTKGEVVGKNILTDSRDSGLARSFERVLTTFTADISEFEVEPLFNEPALFIVQPLFKDKKFIGIMVVRLDETVIYKVIQNYEGLGKAGDIFVLKNVGSRVLFIAPSRIYANVAFKKIMYPDKQAYTPAVRALRGEQGFGLAYNTYGVRVVAGWVLVPQVAWALVPMIPYDQVMQSLVHFHWIYILIFALGILLLLYLLYTSAYHQVIYNGIKSLFTVHLLHLLLLVSFVASGATAIFLIWQLHYTYTAIFKRVKEKSNFKVQTGALFIEQYTTEIEKIAQMIARDLQSGSLAKEDIKTRLMRVLKELPDIVQITIAYAPFAYDAQKRLFGLRAFRKDGSVEAQEINEDYLIPGPEDDPQKGWYDKTLKAGAGWSPAFYDSATHQQREILYRIPFYKDSSKQVMGIIAIEYRLDKIIDLMKNIEIGHTGYAAIVSSANGSYVYHPLEQYVKNNLTILDVAREQNNEELKSIASDIMEGKSGFSSYYDPNTKLPYWVSYVHVPSINWTVAVFFSTESLDLPLDNFHHQRIWILISIVITLLLLSMFLAHIEYFTLITTTRWSVISSCVIALSLISFWIITVHTSYQLGPNMVVMYDQTNLDKYVEFLELDARQRNEQHPLVVSVGLVLHTINFPDSKKVTVSGYLWQKYKKDAAIKDGILFPEATEVTLKEVVRKESNGIIIIGWNFTATFLQKHRYSWFPFDRVHIDIVLASADFEHNVLLAPDFSGYKSVDVDVAPGIANELDLPGFTLERSFFSFTPLSSSEEVGLELLRKGAEKVRLHYNIILDRKLINPFIIFFVPLFIILFSIYAVFLITFKSRSQFDAFKSLSVYTAIFFSAVILHQTLRNQYQSGDLLYIEYFFFFIYITVLLLVLHVLMLRVSKFTNFINAKVSPVLRILFWPIQLSLWFIITMIVFYSLR